MMGRRSATVPQADDLFHGVAQTSDLLPGSLLSARLPTGDRVVLMNVDGEIFALEDSCSHEALALSAGELMPDGTIECVWHGARFDCRTGEARSAPAIDGVPSYAVRVDRGTIMVGPRRAAR
jgi:3-phenylpropionate/trans-cinnamate dioxygenase ferredoxin component